MPERDVLDVLKRADRRLAEAQANGGEGWDFSEWPSCTCGHIYSAYIGRGVREDDPVGRPDDEDGLYVAALDAVLRTSNHRGVEARLLAFAVSDATRDWAGDIDPGYDPLEPEADDPPSLRAARELIGRTVDRIEARQREATGEPAGVGA